MLSPRRRAGKITLALCAFALLTGSRLHPARPVPAPPRFAPIDVHSYANGGQVAIRHLALDLAVDLDQRHLRGSATLDIENLTGTDQLVLDTRFLQIERVSLDGGVPVTFALGFFDPVLGAPLRIPINRATRRVRIEYATSTQAEGLHWMSP